MPRSAVALRDSVGVVTHIVYYDTAYGNWPRVVDRLDELGVRHLRDGVYANPAPDWRDWNERYYRAVELAAAHGIRFNFGVDPPGIETGTLDQILTVVAGRLRHAAEALEAPNEYRQVRAAAGAGRRCSPPTTASCTARRRRNPALRSLPILGPSFASANGAEPGRQPAPLARRRQHPSLHGRALPRPPRTCAPSSPRGITAGSKPVWATEAGFHNALRSGRGEQPPVSERAAAVYTAHVPRALRRRHPAHLRCTSCSTRSPSRAAGTPSSTSACCATTSRRKPAFNALKQPARRSSGATSGGPGLGRCGCASRAARTVRRLVLQKADGTYLVASGGWRACGTPTAAGRCAWARTR